MTTDPKMFTALSEDLFPTTKRGPLLELPLLKMAPEGKKDLIAFFQ
jgi:hypothetical protein